MKITYFGYATEDICDLDQAGYLFSVADMMVLVDGQRISSLDDLKRLAARDRYKDKPIVNVMLLPAIAGG